VVQYNGGLKTVA